MVGSRSTCLSATASPRLFWNSVLCNTTRVEQINLIRLLRQNMTSREGVSAWTGGLGTLTSRDLQVLQKTTSNQALQHAMYAVDSMLIVCMVCTSMLITAFSPATKRIYRAHRHRSVSSAARKQSRFSGLGFSLNREPGKSNLKRKLQVWLCLVQTFPDEPCCPQQPGEAACYVYHETRHTFLYWGSNSALQLAPVN